MAIEAGLEWHAFLSYIWNSGQDQVQLIKRQLCLLLPEVSDVPRTHAFVPR